MEQKNIAMGVQSAIPILFLPKECTNLAMDGEMSEIVFLDLSITSPDTEGNETCIYSGCCQVRLIKSSNVNINPTEAVEAERENSSVCSIDSEDINQMPVILSDVNGFPSESLNQSEVWIDPARSPYVYNHYDTASKQTYSILESTGCITVQQHNTYITQNVYNYDHRSQKNDLENRKKLKKIPEDRKVDSPDRFPLEDEESESELYLSQLSERNKANKNVEKDNFASSEDKNEALKQLMSTDIQSTSKQRKTILFLGKDSAEGQTIQNIMYTDPKIKCSAMEVDHEVIIEDTPSLTSKKKKYQCDRCKQIFHQISEFRKHIVGNHTNFKVLTNKDLVCSECGKKFANNLKLQIHCLGHGDPELECSRCHKVYASKNTLKIHMKIHNRKFPCQYCSKSYANDRPYKTHLNKHSKFVCQYEDCYFVASSASRLDVHKDKDHTEHYSVVGDNNNNDYGLDIEDYNVDNYDNDDRIEGKHGIRKETSDTEIETSFLDDLSDDFEHDLVTKECDLKSELSEYPKEKQTEVAKKETELTINDQSELEKGDAERVKRADSVIAKVMSNELFLANSIMAKKYARNNKTCQVCSKTFSRIGDLKRHLIEHIIKSTLTKAVSSKEGTLNIVCEICKMEEFNTIDKYKSHLRNHAKLTIYKCTFCDKSFSDSSNFSKHKKIHGASHFQCDLCHRKFNSKLMLAKHLELHKKNKPLECKTCNRIFYFESMLNKHIRSVHSKPAASKFVCRFCEVGFRNLKEKWEHEWQVHNIRKTIVDCLVCGAKFRKYTELKRHFQDMHEMDIPSQKKILENASMPDVLCVQKDGS